MPQAEELPALAGVRALDLTGGVAGAVAGMLLADLGADVVKVRPPGAGPHADQRGPAMWDRGKRTATADPASAEDLLALDRLIAGADVLLVGTGGPGITYRGLIDRGRRPGEPCFWVVVPPYLLAGQRARRPGFDPIIQAMSGIMRAQGGPVQADSPAFLTVPINDVLAAGLAALGACAALLARARLGRGQHVGVTLCAASCLLQSEFLTQVDASGDSYPAGGRDFAGPGPLDRLYQTSDGWVRLAAAPGQLQALTEAGLAPAAGQIESGDEALAAAIAALLADLPAAEVIARAHAVGIPAVRARQARELTADAQLIRHGLLTVLDRDDRGVTWVDPGRWLEMPGLPARGPGKAPGPGEHTEMLRSEANRI